MGNKVTDKVNEPRHKKKQALGFSTRFDTTRNVQLQKKARIFKVLVYV